MKLFFVGLFLLLLLVPFLTEAQTIPPVTLTWVDNSSGSGQEVTFDIERKLNAGAFGPLNKVGPNITTYVDSTRIRSVGVANTYCYRVKATNATGSSTYTPAVGEPDICAPTLAALPIPQTVPAAPTGLTAK